MASLDYEDYSRQELIEKCNKINISYSNKNKEALIKEIKRKELIHDDNFKMDIIKYNQTILDGLNKKEITTICKELNLKYSGNKKDLIESILQKKEEFENEINETSEEEEDQNTEEILKKKTVKSLIKICKDEKLNGYSNLKKEEIIQLILESQKDTNIYSINNLEKNNLVALKAIAKDLKISGYSKLKRSDIIDKIIKFHEEENIIDDDNNSEIPENEVNSNNSDGEDGENLSKDNLLKKSKNELKKIAKDKNIEILNFRVIKKSELVELILDDI